MIFYYLALLGDWFVRLFIMPKARDVAKVDPNMSCPVCGHGKGVLRAVVLNVVAAGSHVKPTPTVFCQHTCAECGCRWYEPPVVKVNPSMAWRAIPRTKIEEGEDDSWSNQAGGAFIQVRQADEQVH